MRRLVRVGLVCIVVAAVTAGGLLLATSLDAGRKRSGARPVVDRDPRAASVEPRSTREAAGPPPVVPLYGAGFIDDSGYDLVVQYTPAIEDRASLTQAAAAYRERSRRGRADVRARLQALERAAPRPADFDRRRATLQVFAGLMEMYDGNFAEAGPWFERAVLENPGLDPDFRTNLGAMRGVAALRRGEVENCVACVGPSSCIFPIAAEARHHRPEGAREAMARFAEYLDRRPEDLGVRWLLNVAAMTVGEYPGGVPALHRMPPESTEPSGVGRFVNVATEAGLGVRAPNMLGGSIFDDFNGDGLPDVFVASGDWDLDASLFINAGDGTFRDLGASAGLAGQVLAVNAAQADYDNDGRLDVVALRGGWEAPLRLSLLRNTGGGHLEDVTLAAGLGEPIATQSAAWGDFDNDGLLDLFVAGEFHDRPFDPRNRCRLYRNRGDGTFTDVAERAGVRNERWAKGAAWGDYDGDGFLDLYVSNFDAPNRLYRNNRDGTFADVAPELGLTEPLRSFSCWFWDYDDDGRLDLFVTGFAAWLNDVVADRLGLPAAGERPRLYRNLGEGKFRDVAAEVGLDRVFLPMGSNFADFDNDGSLDIYLATGRPAYSNLVPNVMLRNLTGRRFEDVTTATGTGHLQKGHGVSFADYDEDGDLDLLVEVGGQTPGDRAHNVLFRNPGQAGRSLGLKLVGTRANRSAIGAKLRLDLVLPGGVRRSIHRVIGGGSSYGGNSLSPTIGIGDAQAVEALTVVWPGSGTVGTYRDLPTDGSLEIVEGSDTYRVLPRRGTVAARGR